MLSPSVMALHTSQWHIAMPSGGGIHAINRAICRDIALCLSHIMHMVEVLFEFLCTHTLG